MKKKMDYARQIDVIRGTAKNVQPHKVTVLTGKNGAGKSLVRKLVGFYVAEKLGFSKEKSNIASSTSLQQRTELRSDFGVFSSIMHDEPDNPTSLEAFRRIERLLGVCKEDNKRFIIIDEPEIGMGEETVAALVNWLNKLLNPLSENCYGVLVITHNRYIVENLRGEFLNLEGSNRDEWLNRKIVPTNLEQFKEDSSGLFSAIQDSMNKKQRGEK
jgi:ABC-type Mn2+/Zn2+ transport system ATPase subunit